MEKHEGQVQSRKRDFERKVEELEERLSRTADDADTYKRKNERQDRELYELKK